MAPFSFSNVVQDENENNVLLTSTVGSGVDPVDGSNLQVYPDDEADASRTDSRARKMSTAETVDVAITGVRESILFAVNLESLEVTQVRHQRSLVEKKTVR